MTVRWNMLFARQPRRDRELTLSHSRQSQRSRRKSSNFFKMTPTEHTLQLRTLFKRDTGAGVATERSQATHRQSCTRFCLLHAERFRINVLTQLQVWRQILPRGRTYRLIKPNGVIPTDSLKHAFSVILGEGCHLKVAKMLFPMNRHTSTPQSCLH